MEVNQFNPSKLKQARIFRGLTISELAHSTNITKQAISQYEQGKITPRVETMFKLVNKLYFPREFFYSFDKDTGYNSYTFFRSKVNINKKQLNAHVQVVDFLFNGQQFLEQYIEFPKLNIPDVPIKESWEKEEIEELAKNVRGLWGIDGEPIHNLIFELERNGIFISGILTNTQDVNAYSQKKVIHGQDYCFMLLAKDKKSAVQRQFDAAHEFGHLLMHSWIEEDTDLEPDEKRRMEKEADYFASAFLLPKEAFISTIYKPKLEEYIHLKKYWMVSINAMIVRSYHLNLITYTQYQYLQKQLSGKKMRKTEPYDNVLQLSNPGLLKQAVTELLDDGTIKPMQIVKALKMFPGLIEAVLNLNPGTLNVSTENKKTLELKRKI
ncbi:transcriptional regulator [Lentibacillus kapialis]|uniref:Transcriptional regulator n=1 Tax=Lentibacillus kapialis TaxID=340214 RepID=A0A917PY49_9BACI|nr:XRE family transcriptional regulator [Lentibacillus kapialis]GGJ98911.1 transcriptional regulator [Lentibacillus kapialis]